MATARPMHLPLGLLWLARYELNMFAWNAQSTSYTTSKSGQKLILSDENNYYLMKIIYNATIFTNLYQARVKYLRSYISLKLHGQVTYES